MNSDIKNLNLVPMVVEQSSREKEPMTSTQGYLKKE